MENRFPENCAVLVRYPRDKSEEKADRDTWPWLPGSIVQRCGPDEVQVCVEAPELATLEDGTPAPDGTADGDLYFPCCFRDAAELRPAPDGH